MKKILIVAAIMTLWISNSLFDHKSPAYATTADQQSSEVIGVPIQLTWEQQINQALIDAGFTPSEAHQMLAIAHGESGLRLDAIGDTALQNAKWGPSVGLYQIRTLIHPSSLCRTREYLTSLENQSRCAHEIFLGQGWRAWTVFRNGTYRTWM